MFLTLPSYSRQVDLGMMLAYTYGATLGGKHDVTRGQLARCSLLAYGFNRFWADALNRRQSDGFTHFAMLHADVIPQPGWLDILLEEMAKHDADLVSVVLPLKGLAGTTSTGIYYPSKGFWSAVRRLTLKEVHRYPETFGAADTDYPTGRLAVNTGCWVCRLDRDWCEEVYFTVQDRVSKVDGKYVAEAMPEDWWFSRQVQEYGGKVLATRRVKAEHEDYPNDRPWGTWETDEDYRQ